MQNRSLATFLDAVRIGAALMVVVTHARMHALGAATPADPDIATRLIYYATGQGDAAVIAFFVISGYLVGGKLFHAGRPGFLAKYMLDRATRIYTVALPVLLISFALMTASLAVYGYSYKLRGDSCAAGLGDLAGTLVFLHKGFGVDWCFNTPLWSLVYEVFYYVFFCLVAVAWARRGERIGLACAFAALAVGIYGLFEPNLLWPLSTIWLLGMAVAQNQPLRGRGLVFTGIVTLLLFTQAAVRWAETQARVELATALIMATAILLLRRNGDRPIPPRLQVAAAAGAGVSYSVYLSHTPILNLSRGIAERTLGVQLGTPAFTVTTIVAWAILTALGVAAGVLSWWLFERHTAAIRLRLEGASGARHQPIAAEG